MFPARKSVPLAEEDLRAWPGLKDLRKLYPDEKHTPSGSERASEEEGDPRKRRTSSAGGRRPALVIKNTDQEVTSRRRAVDVSDVRSCALVQTKLKAWNTAHTSVG